MDPDEALRNLCDALQSMGKAKNDKAYRHARRDARDALDAIRGWTGFRPSFGRLAERGLTWDTAIERRAARLCMD